MVVLVRCPYHEDSTPSLALYRDHAFCFGGCGLVPLEWLPENLRELSARQRETRERAGGGFTREQLRVLVEAWCWNLLEGTRRHRLSWLEDRGIDAQAARRFRLGHSGAWFTIPVLQGREVVGVRFRRDPYYLDEDEGPKYRNPKGQPVLLYRPNPGGWPLVVTEGEFDAMLLCLAGCDAVTATAGAGSLVSLLEREGILGRYRRAGSVLHVATDQDAAGEQVVEQLVRRGFRVCRWRWEGAKDVSEALARVPRSQWSSRVRRWIREGEVWSPRRERKGLAEGGLDARCRMVAG
ncbi:toprim domain-containing protein [Thermomicrobium sp. 4228-Ro]|uniref:toprim domain-containing protein n=1 Tax=Thermomicrobium sp. 4228-Ro TaxID=2993937 RepID=UPI00224897A0|nr:toprim domain-containing protein [Thermomicrobium sp. 4228-Ro]MCX2726027.1 toprim domain-containing protein [Thermomicrobium sp. 4228-Ro]